MRLLFLTGLLFSLSLVHAGDGFIFEPWKEVSDSELRMKMERIRETGASHVSFIVRICQQGLGSVQPGECNDFREELATRLKWARVAIELGLSFDITPFPYALMPDGTWEWRGKFRPADVKLWFENYGEVVKEITLGASALGASHQVVGNEMRSLHKHTAEWVGLADKVRAITDRPLVMNVNWFEVPHRFWHAFDVIGISAYYPLAFRKKSSVSEMIAFWKIAKSTILLFSRLYKRPFQFTEVGYSSSDGAAIFPWDYDYSRRKIDLEEQRRAFEAFRRVWQNDRRLIRANIWSTDAPSGEVDRSKDPTYDPFNKPAMEEIKEFFSQRRSSVRPNP